MELLLKGVTSQEKRYIDNTINELYSPKTNLNKITYIET